MVNSDTHPEIDLDELRHELGRTRDALARAADDLDTFAYIVSHDLKEPLRGISTNAGFLGHDAMSPEAEKRVEQIVSLCQQMDRMISELHEYARVGRTDVARVPIDSALLIRAARHDLAALLEERGAVIEIETEMPRVLGDARQLKRVFCHLVENAVLYNDQPQPRVTVGHLPRAGIGDRTLDDVFYIRDNGIGIEPRYHDRIFHVFTRLHRNGEYGSGTGAGLALVQKIVAAHGGTVVVASEGDDGTTFYLTLPLAPPAKGACDQH